MCFPSFGIAICRRRQELCSISTTLSSLFIYCTCTRRLHYNTCLRQSLGTCDVKSVIFSAFERYTDVQGLARETSTSVINDLGPAANKGPRSTASLGFLVIRPYPCICFDLHLQASSLALHCTPLRTHICCFNFSLIDLFAFWFTIVVESSCSLVPRPRMRKPRTRPCHWGVFSSVLADAQHIVGISCSTLHACWKLSGHNVGHFSYRQLPIDPSSALRQRAEDGGI